MSKLEYNSAILPGVIQDLSIFHIKPSYLCRATLDDNIADLSNSIEQKGLLQPIVVRGKDEHFEIVAGNRRYNACKSLGWRKIPCHIVELDDRKAFEVSLVENIHRKTLSPLDEAKAFKQYVIDFGWGGVTDLAIKIGKSASYVTKRMKLIDLPVEVLDSVSNCMMSVSIAEELNPIKDKNKQIELAKLIHIRHLSFRKARKVIRDVYNDDDWNDTTKYYDNTYYQNKLGHNNSEKTRRLFDKSIVALRIAMMRLAELIGETDDNWVLHEILMQHKNMIHAQIDLLIKEKMKM